MSYFKNNLISQTGLNHQALNYDSILVNSKIFTNISIDQIRLSCFAILEYGNLFYAYVQ